MDPALQRLHLQGPRVVLLTDPDQLDDRRSQVNRLVRLRQHRYHRSLTPQESEAPATAAA